MDKMRKDFENWAKDNHYDISWAEIIDDYEILRTRCAWDIWKSSRAALVVKLPKILELEFNSNCNPYSNEVCLCSGYFFDSEELLSELKEAGIKYE